MHWNLNWKGKKIFKNIEISEFFFRSCILIRLNEKKRKFYRMWYGTWNDFFPRNLVSFCFRQRLSGKIVNFLCTIKRFKAVKLRSFTKKRITFKRVIYSRVDSICSIWQLCQRRKRTSEQKQSSNLFEQPERTIYTKVSFYVQQKLLICGENLM